jgi:acyl dehydratase
MAHSEITPKTPLTLIRHQGPMLSAIGGIALRAVLPFGRPAANPPSFDDLTQTILAPAEDLVNRYAAWSGSPGGYPRTLPPHMISQWSIPLATSILRQTRYNLATIINQGVTLRINGDLPRDTPLQLGASIIQLEESDGRARVAVSLTTGTAADPTIIEAVLRSTFPLAGMARSPRKPRNDDDDDWDTIGQWRASKRDGLRFALLTGDFNPIHWVGLAGRLSPFGTTVLQGFGMLARSYEVLARTKPIDEIDVRFVKPVTLPSPPLTVQVRSSGTADQTRLVGPHGRVHLAGDVRYLPA